MTPDVTVIVTMYGRTGNWAAIRDGIRRQAAGCELWVWDNRGGPALEGADEQFVSPRNLFCWPRWFLAAHATTDYVVVVDDDLVFADPDVVSALCEALAKQPPRTLVGAEGVSLRPGKPYWPQYPRPIGRTHDLDELESSVHLRNVTADTRVDIVKGRCIAARRHDLSGLPLAPPHSAKCDDILVSALLGAGRHKPHLVLAEVAGRLVDCDDSSGPVALSSAPDWTSLREAARREYFG